MNQFVLPIGDWSKDGHNESENFTVNVNKTKEELISAYHETTKRLNMTFDTNDMLKSDPIRLLNEWADNILTAEEVKKLQKDIDDKNKSIDKLNSNNDLLQEQLQEYKQYKENCN